MLFPILKMASVNITGLQSQHTEAMFKILAPLALILVPILHNLRSIAILLSVEDLALVVATGVFLKHPYEVGRSFRLTLETI